MVIQNYPDLSKEMKNGHKNTFWSVNRSILKLQPSPSGFKLLRYRVKIDVFTAKLKLQKILNNLRKNDFVFSI